jgi:hypothetical protein
VSQQVQRNANDICGGLRENSTSAVVFVGDASLSPGLKHGKVYERLSELYVHNLEQLGVPVVTRAPGVELQDDGIHWKLTSSTAVLELMSTLIAASALTANFKACPPAALWHWKYLPNPEKHYLFCKRCDKLASDAHLASFSHIKYCFGNVTGFAFCGRVEMCSGGNVFRSNHCEQILESPLEPDHPLQLMQVGDIVNPPTQNIVSCFEIVKALSSDEVKNTSLPESMLVNIHWTDGTVDEDAFTFRGSGDTRDVFQSATKSWVFERPIMKPRERNNCKNEWELYMKNDVLRKVIPRCYGYAAVRMNGQNLVGLLVEKVAFTLDDSYRKVRKLEVSAERTTLVTHMIMRTVTHMTFMSGKGLYSLRDWHVANIAFDNVTHSDCSVEQKLIDWSGQCKESMKEPRDRMAGAMKAFITSLPGPHTWGNDDVSPVSEIEKVVSCLFPGQGGSRGGLGLYPPSTPQKSLKTKVKPF